MDRPTAISLFTGGAGLDLGVDLALGGLRTLLYVEREAFAVECLAARVEALQLAPAPLCTDVREVDGRGYAGRCDLMLGGFPCTDISVAGKGEGIKGERSGLWSEFARLIRVVRPNLVFVENVPTLTSRGLDRVLGDLAKFGYDACWSTLSASACGAPHRRDRIWILGWRVPDTVRNAVRLVSERGLGAARPAAPWHAEPRDDGSERDGHVADAGGGVREGLDGSEQRRTSGGAEPDTGHGAVVHANGERQQEQCGPEPARTKQRGAQRAGRNVAHADSEGRQGSLLDRRTRRGPVEGSCEDELADPKHAGLGGLGTGNDEDGRDAPGDDAHGCYPWPPRPGDAAGWRSWLERSPGTQPSIRRVIDGVAGGMDQFFADRAHRLRIVGNGVAPVVATVAFVELLAIAWNQIGDVK